MKSDNHIPPPLAQRFLRWFLRHDLAEEVQGDLEEQFDAMLEKTSPLRAKLNYWYQVFNYLRPFAIRKSRSIYLNHYPMFRNYFKIGWRNLIKNKGYSLINIGGLAVGMAVAMLIGLWIYDELSFNKYHQNYDRIAQVKVHATYDGEVFTINSHPMPLGSEIRSSYESDFKYVVMSTATEQHIIAINDEKFTQSGRFMQAEAPELLTLKMRHGTRAGLKDMSSILLSASLAEKLFGDTNPINKIVQIDNKLDVKVTGVYEDLPYNSEFKDVTFIAPLDLYISFSEWVKATQDDWSSQFIQIFTQIAPNTDFEKVSAKIKNTKLRHVSGEQADRKPVVFLHPMSRWHLYSEFENGVNVTSERLKFIWFYGIIGVFVLILACINFMNLSTARSEKRAKEVGIRKAIGSLRIQLIHQFFSESFLVAVFSFVLSILIVQLMLPWFNDVADKEISILWANPWFWLAGTAFTFITGLLAGTYPALHLSSFNAVKALKGSFQVGRFAAVPRKVLVVFQFTISITLIIGTIIVYQQIQFAKNRPVGYSRANLLTLQVTAPGFDVLRNELKNTGVVSEIAGSGSPLTSIWSTDSGFDWIGKDPAIKADFGTLAITQEYGETVGWELVEGRDFSKEFTSDSSALVINEAAAKLMGLENPVGEIISWDSQWYKSGDYRIIGVIKDMVMESPFKPAYPTIFFLQDNINCIFVKLNPNVSASAALPKIEAVFKELIPTAPFEYKFVDEEYASKFATEVRISNLAGFCATFAIFISCLGLFGLASFVAEQRTKEIGIRKVLGASVSHLWQMLSKDFVILVVLSCLIAIPIAYYFMHHWLQNYEYRTEITWWVFALAGIGAVAITLLTVSYQTVKAALMNPVESLRSE